MATAFQKSEALKRAKSLIVSDPDQLSIWVAVPIDEDAARPSIFTSRPIVEPMFVKVLMVRRNCLAPWQVDTGSMPVGRC